MVCLFALFNYFSYWQIVEIIQPLSQVMQASVPWLPGNIFDSLPLPGSSSGNQQANLLYLALIANSIRVRE